MTVAAHAPAARPAFSPATILALVLVGVVAFAGLAVLSAYAPELRGGQDGRAHALSKSAIGYAGAPILMKALGVPVTVSRTRPRKGSPAVVILTPERGLSPSELQSYPKGVLTLIVLPKWDAAPDPLRRGFVRKIGASARPDDFQALLAAYAPSTRIVRAKDRSPRTLRGVGGPFSDDVVVRSGEIDALQTISGDGWIPMLADGQGQAVLAQSAKSRSIWVLAEPDLLNNQGLASLDTARAAAMILQVARGGDRPLIFDVTLNGFERARGVGRVMLEPPWLAATLIAVAVTILMGVQALARFGQPRDRGRAFPLGARALVDNSADMMRMARKEHELAPAYAALIRRLVVRASGHTREDWLDELASRRGAAAPADLAAEAGAAKTRDDLLAVARKLYEWRGEMTRERR